MHLLLTCSHQGLSKMTTAGFKGADKCASLLARQPGYHKERESTVTLRKNGWSAAQKQGAKSLQLNNINKMECQEGYAWARYGLKTYENSFSQKQLDQKSRVIESIPFSIFSAQLVLCDLLLESANMTGNWE